MASGGARNRSGPSFDPKSQTSDRKRIVLTALPSEGHQEPAPEFPLPPPSPIVHVLGSVPIQVAGAEDLASRELDVWQEAWRTPQAAAWSLASWRWPIIAEYVRLKTRCEIEANASMIAQLHRYRDQLGLTPAGMKENGWAIASNEVAGKRAERDAAISQDLPEPVTQVRRLRSAASDGAH